MYHLVSRRVLHIIQVAVPRSPQVILVNSKILLFLLALIMEQDIFSRGEAEFEDILLQQLDILGRLYLVVVHKSTVGRAKVHYVELNSPALCAIRSGKGDKAEL